MGEDPSLRGEVPSFPLLPGEMLLLHSGKSSGGLAELEEDSTFECCSLGWGSGLSVARRGNGVVILSFCVNTTTFLLQKRSLTNDETTPLSNYEACFFDEFRISKYQDCKPLS